MTGGSVSVNFPAPRWPYTASNANANLQPSVEI